MYIFRGYKRSQGEFNGITYDKLRFCFLRKVGADGIGALPVIFSGKLPSVKFSDFPSACELDISSLNKFIGKDCEVTFDRFGKILDIEFVQDE